MGLELKTQRNGELRPHWYGRYTVNGKKCSVKLNAKVAGKPPRSLKDEGNLAFELSRARAHDEFQEIIEKVKDNRGAEQLIQNLHKIKYGEKIESCPISDLIKAWESMPRKKRFRDLDPRYVKDYRATLRRFVEFVEKKNSDIKDIEQVSRRIAADFMNSEENRGIAAKTWNDSLRRLRSVFKYLQIEYSLPKNPFDGIQSQSENHIHRRPLNAKEATALLAAVKDNDFTRPLIVCALSTAMRRGDCCLLRWKDVHIGEHGPDSKLLPDHIAVKTSKTGEVVGIPIFPPLMEELHRARKSGGKKDEYVWPDQARMQLENPQGLSWRITKVFEKAGFDEKDRRKKRKTGLRRASIVNFHSLRTTWITEALSRGIPIETVKLVSGHRTTEIVTTHYFKPDLQNIKTAMDSAMPHMLMASGKETKDGEETPARMLEQAWKELDSIAKSRKTGKVTRAMALISRAKESL